MSWKQIVILFKTTEVNYNFFSFCLFGSIWPTVCCVMWVYVCFGNLYRMIVFFVGGMGVSILESCIMTEELAYGCTGIQTAMEASSLGVNRNIPIIAIPINEEISQSLMDY